MINREHDLPITKQAQVLRISRGLRINRRTRLVHTPPVSALCAMRRARNSSSIRHSW